MLQYKIPQNVGIEDKIVGPLTLRQLIIIAVGAGTSYVLFALLSKAYEMNAIEYVVIALPALFAVASALIRINDISLPKFILLTLEYNIKPRRRHWDHLGIAQWIDADIEEKKELPVQTPGNVKSKSINLNELSQILDSGGFAHVQVKDYPDIDRAEDSDLITQAFFGNKPSDTSHMYWRSYKHDRGERLKLLAKLPPTQLKKPEPGPKAVTTTAAQPQTAAKEILLITPPPAQTKPTTVPVPVSVSRPASAIAPAATQIFSLPETHKKRRRKKKNKGVFPPARPDFAVNTIVKKEPIQLIPKTPSPDRPSSFPQSPKKDKMGEFEFRELEKGEIEINLD